MYKVIIITALILCVGVAQGQVVKDFNWYNMETFKLYESQNWNRLVRVGEEALDAGHDYFYLHLRIGIAYFEQEKYRTSQKYFNNALLYNKSDPLTLEYLYYSYLFSGRKADANLLFQRHKKTLLKSKVVNPISIIKSVYTEGGIKFNSENDVNIGNVNFGHLGLEHQIGSRLNIYHGYSELTLKITKLIDSTSQGQGSPQTGLSSTYEYSQKEYFIKGDFTITRGLQIIPSYHFQSIDGIDSKFNNYAYYIGLNQSLGNFDFQAGFGSSNINHKDQTQWSGGLTFYPASNLNFYVQSNYTYHVEDEEEANHVFYEKIGFKIAEKMWLEAHTTFGTIRNFQEIEGFYVYNLIDRITSRFGANALFPVNNHLKILAGFTVENKENSETLIEFQQRTAFIGIHYNL